MSEQATRQAVGITITNEGQDGQAIAWRRISAAPDGAPIDDLQALAPGESAQTTLDADQALRAEVLQVAVAHQEPEA